jgi:hypothetical protein
LIGEVETQVQVRLDGEGGSATESVDKGIVADIAVVGVDKVDEAFAGEKGEVGTNAVNGGL